MTYRRWLSTLVILFAATVVIIVGFALRVRQEILAPDFLVNIGDPTLLAEEKAFQVRNAHCDILVYGDSSTMTGVDPRVLSAETGMSACNISVTWPVVSVLGTMPIDAYLAHNPRPKFLVLQFSAQTFHELNDWDDVQNLGPFSMLLRDKPGLATTWLMLQHGDRAVEYFWMVYWNLGHRDPARLADFHKLYDQRLKDFNDNGGLLTLALPPQTHCDAERKPLSHPLAKDWPGKLRAAYQRDGTTVLIKVSPMPECDPQLQFFHNELAPYVDENVDALPIADFVTGDRHMTAQGAIDESRQLAALINARKGAH